MNAATLSRTRRENHRIWLLAALLLVSSCRDGCDPCDGPLFPDQGAAVATTVVVGQVHTMGDVDGDSVRDLLALETTSGVLHVLRGPDFLEQLLMGTLPGFQIDQPWRYALSVLNPDPIGTRRSGKLHVFDRKQGRVSQYRFGRTVEPSGETNLALDDAGLASLNLTTVFAAVWDGPYPLSSVVYTLAHTFATPSGYVELEFFLENGRTYENLGCADQRGSRCVTRIPAEGEVDYLLADWDKASRFTNEAERVDVISVARHREGTSYAVWFGEGSWSETRRLALSSPLRLDDDGSRILQSRPIVMLLGSDTPFGGSGGVSTCPFLGSCTCGVAVRAPTLFALSRCPLRAPSGGAEIYRLSTPEDVRYQAAWLRGWACPAHPPISD